MSALKIQILAKEQLLHMMEADRVILSFPISTSRFGLGEAEGSLRTPTGRFRVYEKIGGEHPLRPCSEDGSRFRTHRIGRQRTI
jgi:L,D-transpeptidase catalytic domain